MDDLIEKVIEKLKARQAANKSLSLNELPSPPSKQLFIDYGCIIIKDTSIQLIKDLYSLNNDNPWVPWILKGIDYDVRFYFQINERIINFVPRLMVLDWPINFIASRNSLIVANYNKLISRRDIAALPDNAILIKTVGQSLTDESLETCDKKHIKIKIRTEENCIWLK